MTRNVYDRRENIEDLKEITWKNSEGLRKLAEEEKAEEMRKNSLKHRLKRFYRRHFKKPKV